MSLQIYDLSDDIIEIVLSFLANKDFTKFSYNTSKKLTRCLCAVIVKESYRHIFLKWKLTSDKYPDAMAQLKLNYQNLQMYVDISNAVITELCYESNDFGEYVGLCIDGLKVRFMGMIGIGNRSIMAQDPFPPTTKKSFNQFKCALIRFIKILNSFAKIMMNSISDLKKYTKKFINLLPPQKILSPSKSVCGLQRSSNSSNNLFSSSVSLSSLTNNKPNSQNSISKRPSDAFFFSSPFQYELLTEGEDDNDNQDYLAPFATSSSVIKLGTYIAPRSVAYYEVTINSTSNINSHVPYHTNECIAGQSVSL